MSKHAAIKEYLTMLEDGLVTEREAMGKIFLLANDALEDMPQGEQENTQTRCLQHVETNLDCEHCLYAELAPHAESFFTPNEVSTQGALHEVSTASAQAVVTLKDGGYFIQFKKTENGETVEIQERAVVIGGLTLGAALESMFNPPKEVRTESKAAYVQRGGKTSKFNPKGQHLDIDLDSLGL